MKTEELQNLVLQKFVNTTAEIPAPQTGLILKVFPSILSDLAHFLLVEPSLQMDYLMDLTAVDYPSDRIDVVYHISSLHHHHRCTVKVSLNRENPRIRTVSDIWRTAEWHEREVYDLFGVEFTGHPDLRRILTPDGLVGYPLRKDWMGPDFIPKPEDYSGKP